MGAVARIEEFCWQLAKSLTFNHGYCAGSVQKKGRRPKLDNGLP